MSAENEIRLEGEVANRPEMNALSTEHSLINSVLQETEIQVQYGLFIERELNECRNSGDASPEAECDRGRRS